MHSASLERDPGKILHLNEPLYPNSNIKYKNYLRRFINTINNLRKKRQFACPILKLLFIHMYENTRNTKYKIPTTRLI